MRIIGGHWHGGAVAAALVAAVAVGVAAGTVQRTVSKAVDTRPATAPGSAPAGAPARRPLAHKDLEAHMLLGVGRLVVDLASDDPQSCIRAQADLLSLQAGFLAALSKHTDDADLEVRVRVKDLLGKIALETRVSRILLKLPPVERDKLRRLRRRRPRLFGEMLSPDWSRRVKTIGELTRRGTDPQRLASPLLIMSLHHPSSELVVAAADAVAAGNYRSDAVIDALTGLLERTWTWQRGSSRSDYEYDPGRRAELGAAAMNAAALNANTATGTPRAVPKLLELLTSRRSVDARRLAALAEAIASAGELRAIPTLIYELRRTSPQRRWWAENIRGSTTPADYALFILLRLTGQAPRSYGLLYFDYYGRPQLGFAESKDRRAAVAKFRKWWAANRDKGPFKGLKPLPALPSGTTVRSPKLASGRSTSGPKKRTGPPAASPASAPATAPLPRPAARKIVRIDSLRDDLASRVDDLARQLGSGRLASRLRAHRDLLAMQQAYLDSLVAHADRCGPDVRAQLMDVITDALTEARLHNARVKLPKQVWRKLAGLEPDRPHLLKDAFSLSWKRRVKAMTEIRTMDDSNALAEPLVVMGLRGSVPQVVTAAARAAETGRYHSDRIVEALTDILLKAPRGAWGSGWRGPRPDQQRLPHLAALKALGKVRNPKAAPLLLALLLDQRSADYVRDGMLADALAATGDKRVIPLLLPRLARSRFTSSMSTGKTVVTAAPSDAALMALIKLTGQDPKDYKFQQWPRRESFYGFRDNKQRSAAIKKFKDWWARNKTTPAYRDLKPITLPEVRVKSPSR